MSNKVKQNVFLFDEGMDLRLNVSDGRHPTFNACGPSCGFFVFWRQIEIASFAVFHHSLESMRFTVMFHRCGRVSLSGPNISVNWNCIRFKGRISREQNWFKPLPQIVFSTDR